MTKAELKVIFPNFSPKRAFKRFGEGEEVPYEVTGRWVRVARLDDDPWDVMLCNVADMATGMGMKRLNCLIALVPDCVRVHRLNGEAYWQSDDTALVRGWLEAHRVALGIAKRVELSEGAREARSERMKSIKIAVTETKPTEVIQWVAGRVVMLPHLAPIWTSRRRAWAPPAAVGRW
jgi:hypothetical protein